MLQNNMQRHKLKIYNPDLVIINFCHFLYGATHHGIRYDDERESTP